MSKASRKARNKVVEMEQQDEAPKPVEIVHNGPRIRCAYKAMVAVGELKPHPKNRNHHSAEQIDRLAKIIEYQGWRRPIRVSNLSGFMTAGHGALQAAKLMGWTHVPVDYQDYDSADAEYADLIADNSLAAWAELDLAGINADLKDLDGLNFDLELLGIKDFKLDLAGENENDPDETPEPAPEPKVKRGELWVLGNHRLLIDDCTVKQNVDRLMAGEKAELCFTSPPYSDQRDYSGGLELSPKHLAKFFGAPCSLFAVNLGMKRDGGEVIPYWNDYIETANGYGHKFLSWNVWDRGHAYSLGQRTAMFPIEHEWILVLGGQTKELNRTVPNETAGVLPGYLSDRQKDGRVVKKSPVKIHSHRPIGTVSRMPPHMSRKEDINHPAMFPVDLPVRYIEACTKPGDFVFEPFCGSGSTLIACEKTNRRCFGCEIDPSYGQVIIERWQKYTGLEAVREDGVKLSQL